MTQPTLEKLKALKFIGMVKALTEQLQMPDICELAFEERLGLLVDRETCARESSPSNPLTQSQRAPVGVYRGYRLPPSQRIR